MNPSQDSLAAKLAKAWRPLIFSPNVDSDSLELMLARDVQVALDSARAEAIEEAARVCEDVGRQSPELREPLLDVECARKIRALGSMRSVGPTPEVVMHRDSKTFFGSSYQWQQCGKDQGIPCDRDEHATFRRLR